MLNNQDNQDEDILNNAFLDMSSSLNQSDLNYNNNLNNELNVCPFCSKSDRHMIFHISRNHIDLPVNMILQYYNSKLTDIQKKMNQIKLIDFLYKLKKNKSPEEEKEYFKLNEQLSKLLNSS